MIGKKKTAQNPSAAQNRQLVENSRKNVSASGSGRAENGAVSSNSAKKPSVKSSQNPQNSSKKSKKKRLPQNRANSVKTSQNGSVNGKSGLGKSTSNRDVHGTFNSQSSSALNVQSADRPHVSTDNSPKSAPNAVPRGSVNGKSRFRLKKKSKKSAGALVNKQTALNGQNGTRVAPNGTANRSDGSAQLPHSSAKPVNEQARKAADKAALAKTRPNASEKKRPYRGGNYTLYFILAAIVIGIVMVILSNTVLFKCGSIEVSGTTRYTADEIIAATGIKTGDNLLHIDTKKAEDSVMDAFAFVDNVSVKKNFPTKIVIEITEAQNWFALNQDGKTVVISRGGRVLGTIPSDGLVVVKGFEAESLEMGIHLASAVDAKNSIIMQIFETVEKVGLANVTEIDLTDRFSIKITIEDRIVLNIGSSVQLESKLRVAQALIEKEIAEDERVSVLLTNPEKVAVESLPYGQNPVQSSAENPAETDSVPENEQNSSTETPVSQSASGE